MRPRPGISCRLGRGGAQGADQPAALNVLVQHHAYGTGVARKAGLLQRREKDLLLLVMVMNVRKLSQEVERIADRFRRHLRTERSPVGQRIQYAQAAQDDLVLFHQ